MCRRIFRSVYTLAVTWIIHIYWWCIGLSTLSHIYALFLRINSRTHLHARTQTHPAKRDYPCQRFGRGLIWSNGGSESWFVFPSLVRLRSSLPGDTTSCILTPSDTEMHPQTHHPAHLTCAFKYTDCLCASALSTIPSACNRATDSPFIYKSTHFTVCSPFLCFWSAAAAASFFNVMWTWQAPLVHCNANRQMRRERLFFSPWKDPLSPFNVMSNYLMSPGTEP